MVRLASFLRICRNASPYFLAVPLNSLSFGVSLYFRTCAVSDLVRFWGIVRILGLPPLAVVGLIALCSVSKSRTFRSWSSVGLTPVSLLDHSLRLRISPDAAMNLSSCSSVASLGICSCFVNVGISHFIL